MDSLFAGLCRALFWAISGSFHNAQGVLNTLTERERESERAIDGESAFRAVEGSFRNTQGSFRNAQGSSNTLTERDRERQRERERERER